jgi:hypothetical protein
MEKMKFNINENRDLEIKMHNFKNIDTEYTFYYDETNNLRKFWFKNENKFNIPIADLSKNFVLGGVSHLKSKINFDTEKLKQDLKLPNTVKEMKLTYIAKGDFLSCLKSKKLEIFLDWFVSNDLFLHYSNLNILYWSVIDILESMIPQDLLQIHMELKTILYEFIKIDLNKFIEILYKYEYPNIDRKKANDFLDEILNYIKINETKFISKYPTIDKSLIGLVYQIIEESKNTELTFIMDEKNHILIDDLFIFYKRPFGIFKNSYHIFDEESSIEDIFERWEFLDDKKKWENFEFQNSTTNDLIQISDVIIGLIGKLFIYINDTNFNELTKLKENLSLIQVKNFTTLAKLFEKSDNQSTALIHSIQSLIERDKLVLLLTTFKG